MLKLWKRFRRPADTPTEVQPDSGPVELPGDPYEIACAAELNGNYADAAQFFRSLGDSGDPRGYHRLSELVRLGQGTAQSDRESASLLHRAAEQGCEAAQYDLGVAYRNGGGGIGISHSESRRWLSAVAEGNGCLAQAAQVALAELLEQDPEGAGTASEAVKWYRKAGDAGDTAGQLHMARLFGMGSCGLTHDPIESMRWYKLAAARGNSVGEFNIARMYHNGEGVLQDYVQAEFWYAKAVSSGAPSFLFQLGKLHEDKGELVAAHAWYNLATSSDSFELDAILNSQEYSASGVAAKRTLYAESRNRVAQKLEPHEVLEAQQLAMEIKSEHEF